MASKAARPAPRKKKKKKETEAKNIKKTWQEYTEDLYKKDLHDPVHDGVITHQSQTSWNVKSSGPLEVSL